jgi:hypothetical protein
MAAEFQPWSDGAGNGLSPGGFEFGVTGWRWAAPIPSSVTFYLDGTASVFDQYGRPIKGVVLPNGKECKFATTPPKADDSDVVLRKQFATHAEVVEIMLSEKVDLIQEMNSVGTPCPRCKGTGKTGERHCAACQGTGKRQTIVCSGWPQLPYEQLKRIHNIMWPFDRVHDSRSGQRCGCINCSIPDAALRKDALRIRSEMVAVQDKLQAAMGD